MRNQVFPNVLIHVFASLYSNMGSHRYTPPPPPPPHTHTHTHHARPQPEFPTVNLQAILKLFCKNSLSINFPPFLWTSLLSCLQKLQYVGSAPRPHVCPLPAWSARDVHVVRIARCPPPPPSGDYVTHFPSRPVFSRHAPLTGGPP